ncbi:flavin-containing monooxygenase [Reinekea sp.]|jgi:cation diffusion facilitator CzcD-associated flavoprotein CzcO|uniref:flavin-containing monooxygenase n=1 Tax=Reinekea sp. TaxID=1970455 RepID=UPI003988FEDD
MSIQHSIERPYAVIGAGPMGLCTAKQLSQLGLPWIGFELNKGVGGLWDIENPHSTMYKSAHLISSKRKTEFADFPMAEDVPTYPSHHHLKAYFNDYADHFNLKANYRFNTKVLEITKQADDHWIIKTCDANDANSIQSFDCAGVLIANGTLHQPRRIESPGEFAGERIHSAHYKSADIFADKRVLIVGCGNSGCDIAVDAVHRAKSVAMSVRRGYYFLPKFVLGRAIDTLGGAVKLPMKLKQIVDGLIIKALIGKPSDYGLPNPDYKLYESHPVVNSIFLHHIGHGDIAPVGDIKTVSGNTVTFKDGNEAEFDLIVEATGYDLHYPFIDPAYINWQGAAPSLFLNAFSPVESNIFVMGMVEAAGLGWQGRDEQAKLVAQYLFHKKAQNKIADTFDQEIKEHYQERFSGGLRYLQLDRMAYYVHKETYLAQLSKYQKLLEVDDIQLNNVEVAKV